MNSPQNDAAITFLPIPTHCNLHGHEGLRNHVTWKSIDGLDIWFMQPSFEKIGHYIVAEPNFAQQGFVIEHTKRTWHTSRHINQFFGVSEEFSASLLVLHKRDTMYKSFHGSEDGLVSVFYPVNAALIRTGTFLVAKPLGDNDGHRSFVVGSTGPLRDLNLLIRACVQCTRELSDIYPSFPHDDAAKHIPSALDGSGGLGICTWEALGAGKDRPLLSTIDALLCRWSSVIHMAQTSLLLDDGWQNVLQDSSNSRRLLSFDMDHSLLDNFLPTTSSHEDTSSTLCKFISFLQEKYPFIQYYGVWMTLAGYWHGLCPDPSQSQLAEKYGPLVRATLPFCHAYWYIPNPWKIQNYFDDYFKSLKTAGISFIKVDDQADWEYFSNLEVFDEGQWQTLDMTPKSLFKLAWQGMLRAARRYFGESGVLHSMALGRYFLNGLMSPNNLITGDLQYVRTSDDVFPNVPQAHTWHIYQNALELWLTNAISEVIPDADMVTTSMATEQLTCDWAEYHVAFRTHFSSTTIWLSDPLYAPIQTHLLDLLLAKLKNKDTGSVGHLRPVQLSKAWITSPLTSCIFLDLTSADHGPGLKIASTELVCLTETPLKSLLSVWNVHTKDSSAIDFISLSDIGRTLPIEFVSLDPKTLFFIYSALSHRLHWRTSTEIQQELEFGPAVSVPVIPIFLPPAGWDSFRIIEAYPLDTLDEYSASPWIACVGLVDKLAGLVALTGMDCDINYDGRTKSTAVHAHLSHAGQCGFVLQLPRSEDTENEFTMERGTVYIDMVAVDRDCVSVTRFEQKQSNTNEYMLKVDMLKHFYRYHQSAQLTSTWQVDVHLLL